MESVERDDDAVETLPHFGNINIVGLLCFEIIHRNDRDMVIEGLADLFPYQFNDRLELQMRSQSKLNTINDR